MDDLVFLFWQVTWNRQATQFGLSSRAWRLPRERGGPFPELCRPRLSCLLHPCAGSTVAAWEVLRRGTRRRACSPAAARSTSCVIAGNVDTPLPGHGHADGASAAPLPGHEQCDGAPAKPRCAARASEPSRAREYFCTVPSLTAGHACGILTSAPVAQAGDVHGGGGAVPVGDPASRRHRASAPTPLRLLRHPPPSWLARPPQPPPAGILSAPRLAATWRPARRRQRRRAPCNISPSPAVDGRAAPCVRGQLRSPGWRIRCHAQGAAGAAGDSAWRDNQLGWIEVAFAGVPQERWRAQGAAGQPAACALSETARWTPSAMPTTRHHLRPVSRTVSPTPHLLQATRTVMAQATEFVKANAAFAASRPEGQLPMPPSRNVAVVVRCAQGRRQRRRCTQPRTCTWLLCRASHAGVGATPHACNGDQPAQPR